MYLLIFILGTIFGSFGSVILTRLENKVDRKTIKSILLGFSKCPNCKKRLKAKNLIPLRSFLNQKGKCAFCKKNISLQYPILEITSGIIFMFSYYLVFDFGNYTIVDGLKPISYIFWAITNRGLLLLIVQDIKKQELHMPIRIFTTIWILLLQFLGLQGNYQGAIIGSILFATITAIIYFGAKFYIKRKYNSNQEGFGQGDIFLGFSIGALIPFVEKFNILSISRQNHLKIIISIMLVASIIGIIYAFISKIIKKPLNIKISKQQRTIIPFFPCLIIAFWIMIIFGNKIISFLFL